MSNLLRISIAVIIYILIALTASKFIRKTGKNLKEIKNRAAVNVLLIGAISNIGILILILFLIKFLDKDTISSLGLKFTIKDFLFAFSTITLVILSAVIFIYWLKHTQKYSIEIRRPLKENKEAEGMLLGIGVLFLVALQEEVLFRGYITHNTISYGIPAVIIISTLLFAGIHVLTNKVSIYQFISWLLGGIIFAFIYLISGSIWVAILLHLATDLTNMLLFNIVGKYSFVTFIPTISDGHRAVYRAIFSLMTIIILISFYGTQVRISN